MSSSLSIPIWLLDSTFVIPATMIMVLAFDICGPRKQEIVRALHLARISVCTPEARGVFAVLGILVVGLLFGTGGLLASHEALEALRSENPDLVEMKRIWPILSHPDSLLIVQQLLRAVGFGLLLRRGGWGAGASNFVPALLQLTAASGVRLYQWSLTNDYLPEGPLGGSLSATIAMAVFIVQFAAAWKAYQGSLGAPPWRNTNFMLMQIVAQLAICVVTACTNHLAYAASSISNVAFTGIEAADLVAAPMFAIAACIAAQEDHQTARSFLGPLHVLSLAQIIGFIWFMDFTGLFDDPSSPDPFVRSLLQSKIHLQTNAVHGDPYALMGASQVVQLVSLIATCFCVQMTMHEFEKKGVVGARVEVINALEIVPYTDGVFSNDEDACCAICLTEFDDGDELRKLPCDHKQFHAGCVDRWLAKAGRCPLCVGDVTKSQDCPVSTFCK